MIEPIKKQWEAKVLVVFFLIFTFWWITLQIPQTRTDFSNMLFGGLYGIVALWGGIWGIRIALKWGGIKSLFGKSILMFTLGLLSQEVGQIAYFYYVFFLNQPVPYPSVGDYFFWATIPLYILGVIYLAQASGVHISLQSVKGKLQAVLIPSAVLIACYAIFLSGYTFDISQPVKTAIDLGVPIGEGIYISIALLTYTLTRGVLGGMMKNKVLFIIIALLAEFIADWVFLYQVSREIWYAGGVNDYMYLVAYTLMALALISLQTVLNKLREG